MRQTEGARRFRSWAVLVIVLGMMMVAHGNVVQASGENGSEAEKYPYGEPQVEPLWKLGRGINNLVLGLPAEIVQNPVIEILKADTVFGVGAGALEGTLVGIGKGFWRMGAGFLDIVTFPAADLDPWYDAELLPPYPF